jgi:hypothetical protein
VLRGLSGDRVPPAVSAAGNELLSIIRSTMLPPSTEKARCATVSPIAAAMTVLTASCVSGLAPAAVLACCNKLAISARSLALRMRSSRINVSEKESRICFGVIEDTPPCVYLPKSKAPGLRGRSDDDITKGC